MILDRLEQADRYACVHPLFGAAFDFLRQPGLGEQAEGRREIQGQGLYAVISRSSARPRDKARLEAHRRYIDIQFVVSGTEEMGWKSRSLCLRPEGAYDPEKDVEFYAEAPETWVAVGPGAFAVFFPEDAHAPLIGCGELRKVVVKVALE